MACDQAKGDEFRLLIKKGGKFEPSTRRHTHFNVAPRHDQIVPFNELLRKTGLTNSELIRQIIDWAIESTKDQ